MNKVETDTLEKLICFHCGDYCSDDSISIGEKIFCCNGCKTVYELLDNNKLCSYYTLNDKPGISPTPISNNGKFDFLDSATLKKELIDFTDGEISTVTFFIPQMHCSSCIWLLENLYKINSGIKYSRVNFLEKKLSVQFKESDTSLKAIVELLSSLGYEPLLDLANSGKKKNEGINKRLYYKIGVAGFAFGNIMLLSFPEYLSFINKVDPFLDRVFGFLIILLSLPVFFFSSSDYFKSAFGGLKEKVLNIDVPISLGIAIQFIRSLYEIITGAGSGYMDSMSGLVFFLLVGKLFQTKTYDLLNFERDYKSFFPLSVTTRKAGKETSVPVANLQTGDKFLVRNNELIPADSYLLNGNGFIDYSFVTGESRPIEKKPGEIIYAGGKQTGTAIELEVIKKVSQSYITQLWNDHFNKKMEKKTFSHRSDVIAKYFTSGILIISMIAFIYWIQISLVQAVNIVTAILIVACPCALALSIPFTFGNTMRIFGRNKFYLRNIFLVEKLAKINSIIFDKTGTITKPESSRIHFEGNALSKDETMAVKSLVRNSSHPLSRIIYDYLPEGNHFEVKSFSEIIGQGLEGTVNNNSVKLGSGSFVNPFSKIEDEDLAQQQKSFDTTVYLSINNEPKGSYKFSNLYRDELKEVISSLKNYELSVLSGDNDNEKNNLISYFGDSAELKFFQTPSDKLDFVRQLQEKDKSILMIGDGLNDAGALKASDAGISITENTNNFTPASDAILDADSFGKLGKFIEFSKTNIKIISTSFVLSVSYNVLGLYFAVTGNLTPLIAAILMPVSSISVVLFATATTALFAKRRGLL
ncbi:MAG: HAD family hydrolase [Ignavibacteriales bacterium]|nr:MAG: HAD family hydrolase [Ignavibacteriales bacterium]